MDGYEVPEKIKNFPINNDIQHFQYDRPFHKGPRDKDNEFKVQMRFKINEIYCRYVRNL